MANLGPGFARVPFWEGDDGGPDWRGFQPPAVVQQPPGQPRSSKLDPDYLCHDLTMPGPLAEHLSGTFRICGFLCRFCADRSVRDGLGEIKSQSEKKGGPLTKS
jgi:hypothetical protein